MPSKTDLYRKRCAYIALSAKEKNKIVAVMSKMKEEGFGFGTKIGGKFARIAILTFCELYISGQFPDIHDIKEEEEIKKRILNHFSERPLRNK